MDIQIRKAQPEDAPALARLLRSIGWSGRMEAEPVPGVERDKHDG